ncbi:MAG: hypothetical protein J7K04_09800 [Spirochaetales bacterium]|nr:hypothetical protein [Spirochaetales bacterium]
MEMYDVETLQVKQRKILQEIYDYVSGAALGKDLYSVENDLFRYVLRMGHAFLCEVIARHGTGKGEGPITVGDDDLPYHMDKETTYQSVFGEVKINRAYYWSKGERGVFPLDAELNLPYRRYSYLLDKWVQSSVVEMPYDKSVDRFAELLGIPVTKLGQQNVAREVGSYFAEFYRQKPIFDPSTEGSLIGVQADGKGVRMIGSEKPQALKDRKPRREKGEKSGGLRRMAVATADFTFNPGARSPEEMVAVLMKENIQAKAAQNTGKRDLGGGKGAREALNIQVAASMSGKQVAFAELAERVKRRDPEGEKKIVVFLDGEKALEDQLLISFREAGLAERIDAVVLDIMHVMEYVWEAGTALHGEKGAGRNPWVREHALAILEGRVIGGLKQILTKQNLRTSQVKDLKKAITYFENHKHMMQYDRYFTLGYPIATGLIEGTCGSLIKDQRSSGSKRFALVIRWDTGSAQFESSDEKWRLG